MQSNFVNGLRSLQSILFRWVLLLFSCTVAVGAAQAQLKSTYTELYDFTGSGYAFPWFYYQGPSAGVTFDSAGNMYGTTYEEGAINGGMVWEITASGDFIDLHDQDGFGKGPNCCKDYGEP